MGLKQLFLFIWEAGKKVAIEQCNRMGPESGVTFFLSKSQRGLLPRGGGDKEHKGLNNLEKR